MRYSCLCLDICYFFRLIIFNLTEVSMEFKWDPSKCKILAKWIGSFLYDFKGWYLLTYKMCPWTRQSQPPIMQKLVPVSWHHISHRCGVTEVNKSTLRCFPWPCGRFSNVWNAMLLVNMGYHARLSGQGRPRAFIVAVSPSSHAYPPV